MKTVFLVEDDPILGRSLCVFLEVEGFQVKWSRDQKSAIDTVSSDDFENTDIVILDVNLPDGSGFNICKNIRSQNHQQPIVFLTAMVDENSIVAGFEAGANDYVKKPFSNKELLARLKAHLRDRSPTEKTIRFGELVISPEQRKVSWMETSIELNRREFDILKILIQRADTVVTRESLITSLGKDNEIFDRTIDSHISHIRHKLKKSNVDGIQIASIYGVGYRLEKL